MLKTRILTALVLGPALLALLLLAPAHLFLAVMAGLFVIGGWEYGPLCGVAQRWRIPLTILYLLAFVGVAWVVFRWETPPSPRTVLLTLGGIWVLALLRLIPGPPTNPASAWKLNSLLFSFPLLVGAWYALVWLRYQPDGSWWIMGLLITIWAADVGAYFTGKQFGRNKLAPVISPGKTWEGVAGGMLLGAIALTVAVATMPIANPGPTVLIILLALIVVPVSVGGDLYISLHKRSFGIKDSGNIFPGHGGVLDRFDSLLAAAPIFALGKLLLEI